MFGRKAKKEAKGKCGRNKNVEASTDETKSCSNKSSMNASNKSSNSAKAKK